MARGVTVMTNSNIKAVDASKGTDLVHDISAVPEHFRSVSALSPGQSVVPQQMRTVTDALPTPRGGTASAWTVEQFSLAH
jgi:hypothetical protein